MARTIAVILSGDSSPLAAAYAKAQAATEKWARTTTAAQAEAAKASTKTAAQIKADFNSQAASTERANQRMIASLRARESEMAKASAAATKYGKSTAFLTSHSDQIDKLAHGMTLFGGAAALAFGAAVKESSDFNAEMARVGAFSDDARAHIDQLRKLAMTTGTSIGYSATQSADAMEELVKAGVSATDMINGGLKGALQLAAAGQIDVSQATSIAASAMTDFNLQGAQIPHLADLLAAGADKALGGVGDLGDALNYAGTQAHTYGLSVEDTIGVLAEFASYGQLGSKAGTELAEVLSRLGAPTGKAAKEMAAIGLNVYDANGNFVDMTTLAGRLQKAFKDLSPAQRNAAEQIIFGQRAMQGANILISQGANKTQDWINKVNDQGFAAQTAARKMDSLTGDVQKLKAALTNAFIGAGQSSQGPLRAAVQEVTKWIDDWNNLSDTAKTAIADIVGAIAVLGLGGAATIKVLTGVAGMKKALIDLGITGKTAGAEMAAGAEAGAVGMEKSAAGMSKMQKAAGGAVAGIIGVQTAGMVANKIIGDYSVSTEQATSSLLGLAKSSKGAGSALGDIFVTPRATGDFWGTTNINDLNDAINRTFNRSTSQKVNDWITGIGSDIGLAKGQFGQLKDQYAEVDTALTNLTSSGSTKQAAAAFEKIAAAMAKDHVSTQQMLATFPGYKAALQDQANQLGGINLTAKQYAEWMGGKVPAAVKKAEAATKSGSTAQVQNYLATQKTSGAQITWTGVMKAATEAAKNEHKILVQQRTDLLKSASAALTASGDQISFKQAIADASKAAKDNKHTLDLNTQAGRDNRTALNNLASSALTYIQDLIKNKASTDKLTTATHNARDAFIRTAEQMGATKDQAKRLADQYGLVPKTIVTKVSTPGASAAVDQIDKIIGQIDKIHGKTVEVRVNALTNEVTRVGGGGTAHASSKATGGPIVGPGSGTSDSVPIMASNGEYMQTAAAHRFYGTTIMDALRARRIPRELLAGFAGGGPIDRDLVVRTMMPASAVDQIGAALGAAQQRAETAVIKAARQAVPSFPGLSGGTSGANQKLGLAMMVAAGWPMSQWPSLKALGNRESGWNAYAVNASSGAYGIGQSLGHGHPYALGDARAQIAWMLDYIRGRYGSPAAAWAHEMAAGWYAAGGPISGPGGPTSDRVPIMASNGEFMVNAAAYSKFGPIVEWINAQGLASGGPVRPAAPSSFGSSAVFSVAAIVALIRQLTNPIADLASATKDFKKMVAQDGSLTAATRAYNNAVANRTDLKLTNAKQTEQARAGVASASDQVTAAKLALQKLAPADSKIAKAQSALVSAENSLSSKRKSDAEAIAKLNDKINLAKKGSVAYENLITEKQLKEKSNSRDIAAAQDKVNAARKVADKAGVNTDKITAAQKRLTQAENDLTKARAHQSTVSRENALQTAQASAAVTKAKAKVDALKNAADNLTQAQQALADSAKQVSDTFSTEYLSKSTSIADWMQSMTLGNSDLTKLNNQIKKLRKMGLSETLIQQIIGMGQNDMVGASTIASQIISGGTKTIDKLDKAAQGLQDAADKLGYTTATGVTRAAAGGFILGPGTSTSDSINARLSNGEYVVNAAATARHRAVLDHINYGSGYMRFASGGYVSAGGGGISEQRLINAVAAIIDSRPVISGNNIGYDPAALVYKLDSTRRSKMHGLGIGVRR